MQVGKILKYEEKKETIRKHRQYSFLEFENKSIHFNIKAT